MSKIFLKGIENSKNVPFERVLFALGIRHVGETLAAKIARYVCNIDTMMKMTADELTQIDDVGTCNSRKHC